MEWTRLSVICPKPAEEAVVAVMSDIARGGCSVEQTCTGTRISAYLPSRGAAAKARGALEARLIAIPNYLTGGRLEVHSDIVQEEDWGEAWKDYYHPFRIGRRLVIKPSWEEWPPADCPEAAAANDLVIEIDPGQAFGTGQHQTTRLCLRILEDLTSGDSRVLDVGCGSGILSIAAAGLGAAYVVAVDTDETAVRTARENMARNAYASDITVLHDRIDAARGKYTIIVANITAPTVKGLARTAYAKLQEGGYYIGSGFTGRHADGVVEVLRETGFHIVDTRKEADWRCVVGRKPD